MQSEPDIAALADAVTRLHHVKATFVRTVEVHERFKGQAVWHGIVSEFDIEGHHKAKTCYAWSEPTESDKRRYFAVLAITPVTSPETAIRAAIASRHRKEA